MPSPKLKLGIETKENKTNKIRQIGTSFFHLVDLVLSEITDCKCRSMKEVRRAISCKIKNRKNEANAKDETPAMNNI